ncbi:MAG: GDSL-type esterase/lipase family protein, partial [Oscillospiraceae bacterium]|nr:GDSL-type esterase/lipase family protein [Oscillospiraceae bacterium]
MTPRRYDLANIPGLKVLGRCPELTKSLTLFWTGSGLAVAVAATELWVELYADYERLEPWLDIIINGDLSQRLLLTRGQQRICVFRGQSPDIVKQVRLLRDTQAMSDDDRTLLQIRALETDGHFLSPPEPALKLEFIGDSITSGEGASGAVSETDWVPACFSAYYNYTYETAARLAADYHCLSQSGWGVYTGWDGNRRHALPLYYPQICGVLGGARNLRLGATAAWDFTAFKPDYIIINLGTNDAGALQASPAAEQAELSAQIEQAAVAFWQQLRQLNPASYLIWAYGMLGHPLLPQLTRALQTYQRLSSDDRAELLLLPSAEQTGYGSRQHPGKAAHRAAAAVLTRRVRQLED